MQQRIHEIIPQIVAVRKDAAARIKAAAGSAGAATQPVEPAQPALPLSHQRP